MKFQYREIFLRYFTFFSAIACITRYIFQKRPYTDIVNLLKRLWFFFSRTYLEGLKYIRIFKKLIEISYARRCISRIRLRSSRIFLSSFGCLSRFLQSFLSLALQFFLRLPFLFSFMFFYFSRLIHNEYNIIYSFC